MAEPDWARMGEERYTPLVSALLQRLYPDAEIIDGAGGDGGRDVQRRPDGTLIVFQLKYFPVRVGKSQRAQVKRSLRAVAKSSPDEWHLVVPVNHNPSELIWFDGLRLDFPFVRTWHGVSWLNQALSEHPDLLRFYSTVNDEVVDRLVELQKEQSIMLGGVPDLARRVVGLAERAHEVAPDYGMSFATDGPHTQVTIFAKDPARARPIHVTAVFDPTADLAEYTRLTSEFDHVMAFGGQITLARPFLSALVVDAPAELGISGTSSPDSVDFISLDDTSHMPVEGTLTITTSAGLPVGQIDVTFNRRQHGHRGTTLHGHGPGKLLDIAVRLERHSGRGGIDLEPSKEAFAATPGPVAAALELLGHVKPGNTLRVAVAGLLAVCEIDTEPYAEYAQWVPVLHDLADVQAQLSYSFAVPDPLTGADKSTITRARRLLAGETVRMSGAPIKVHIRREKLVDSLANVRPGGALVIEEDNVTLTVGTRNLSVGPGYWTANVRLVNRRQLQRLRPDLIDHDPEAVFEVTSDDGLCLTLGRLVRDAELSAT